MASTTEETVGVNGEIPKPLHSAIKHWLVDQEGYSMKRLVSEAIAFWAKEQGIVGSNNKTAKRKNN